MFYPDWLFVFVLLGLVSCMTVRADDVASVADDPIRYRGGDISMLIQLETRGAVYRDTEGNPVDIIPYLRSRGWNLFRIRLFVDPSKDFDRSKGAVQDLEEVRQLAKRVKQSGADVFLCLHYSDQWADPKHQTKPDRWKDLSFEELEKQVETYTTEVLQTLKDDDVVPTIVQIGNEITAGMLWPDGQLTGKNESVEFAQLARLLQAGIRSVRSFKTEGPPIRIALHVHGGGQPGVPLWFFKGLENHRLDFDLIAVSVYPSWKDSLDVFAQQARTLVQTYNKDLIVAETGYPYRKNLFVETDKRFMKWPLTPQGQSEFARQLIDILRQLPQDRGAGLVWWYPEAIPLPGLFMYQDGTEGVFDSQGCPLPVIETIGDSNPFDKNKTAGLFMNRF
ncbi:MAG: hypothetical protein KatS3mg104_2070 [Phycisphaerae bacterium]|jgi:arabinogalactan endo-1,4-beta-galactosidase|nr:MAG: hypothetical protein KatS3mg104_2070 [Phycisphaerae bacterium]